MISLKFFSIPYLTSSKRPSISSTSWSKLSATFMDDPIVKFFAESTFCALLDALNSLAVKCKAMTLSSSRWLLLRTSLVAVYCLY